MDVGCGTGILSMFCVKAGAAHVYAVDCSDIINQAKQIVSDNNMADKITCIQAKVEDMTLPCGKVDIIVSEWMGYFLLYESMLNTVIYARDNFLKPGGTLLPDKANMYIAGIEDSEYKQEKIEFWNNVYGFNMSCIKNIAIREPLVDTVEAAAQMTTACKFMSIDLNTVKVADLTFVRPFTLKGTRNDFMHAFIAWFDVEFSKCLKPISFTTGPGAKYTHWKQTVFYTTEVLSVSEQEEIKGSLSCKPNAKNPRDLDITITVDFDGKHCSVHLSQDYFLR
jgi:protein arginine N-methyltransferase 1